MNVKRAVVRTAVGLTVFLSGYLAAELLVAPLLADRPGIKRQYFVRDVDRDDIVYAWNDGLKKNSLGKYAALEARYNRAVAAYRAEAGRSRYQHTDGGMVAIPGGGSVGICTGAGGMSTRSGTLYDTDEMRRMKDNIRTMEADGRRMQAELTLRSLVHVAHDTVTVEDRHNGLLKAGTRIFRFTPKQ